MPVRSIARLLHKLLSPHDVFGMMLDLCIETGEPPCERDTEQAYAACDWCGGPAVDPIKHDKVLCGLRCMSELDEHYEADGNDDADPASGE